MVSKYKTILTKRVLSCSPFDNPYVTTSIRGSTDLCPECFKKLKVSFKGILSRSKPEKHHDRPGNCYVPEDTKKFNFIGVYIQPYDNSIFQENCCICGKDRCHGISPDDYLSKFRIELKRKLKDHYLYVELVTRIGKGEADKVALVMNNPPDPKQMQRDLEIIWGNGAKTKRKQEV